MNRYINVPPGATQSFKILFATFIKFALTVEGVKQWRIWEICGEQVYIYGLNKDLKIVFRSDRLVFTLYVRID